MIAAVILAAGKSERMGRPKALLPLGEETFVEHLLQVIRDSRIGHTTVIVGRHRDEIIQRVRLPGVVYNPDYELGMTTSFQAGIRSIPGGAKGAMFFLVDHPLVRARTVESLIERFSSGAIVIPVYRSRRGHPVLFAREVLDEILALPPDRGVNTIVRARPDRVVEVAVDDPGVLVDIDTPEDLDRMMNGESCM